MNKEDRELFVGMLASLFFFALMFVVFILFPIWSFFFVVRQVIGSFS